MLKSRRQIGIPAITGPSTWHTFLLRAQRADSWISASVSPQTTWLGAVFPDREYAPNYICLLPAKEKQLHVFAALQTISTCLKPPTEEQLHAPFYARGQLQRPTHLHRPQGLCGRRRRSPPPHPVLLGARQAHRIGLYHRRTSSAAHSPASTRKMWRSVEEKEKRLGVLHAELARAFDAACGLRERYCALNGRVDRMGGGGLREKEASGDGGDASPRGSAGLPHRKGWTYTMEGQFLEVVRTSLYSTLLSPSHTFTHMSPAVQEPITDAPGPNEPPCTHGIDHRRLGRAHARAHGARAARARTQFSRCASAGRTRAGRASSWGAESREPGGQRAARDARARGVGRVKETQSTNRSLRALGDVVAALRRACALSELEGAANFAQLTVLNLSLLAAHLNESLTSLRFATKMSHARIGTANKVQITSAGVLTLRSGGNRPRKSRSTGTHAPKDEAQDATH
ncbi:hypothetical protein FB451DRAFT_1439958 [Mycena latifolia]|nr:hypothetical protein FB451DRAFT_1439958 [Mycena latifolia]